MRARAFSFAEYPGGRIQIDENMDHLNVALLGDKNIGKEIAKKGTASDFTIYHLEAEGEVVSFFEPTLYPEKLQPLLHCINPADFVVLVVNEVDRFFGETVVALDLLGKKNGLIAVGEGADEQAVKAFLKGTALEKYEFVAKDANLIRGKVSGVKVERAAGPTKIPIDHSFAVKSVGAVVLGIVARGSVRKHQELELYPTGKKVVAKSLQVQDEDVEEASCGSRVGVAMKGAEAEELERGFVLAEPGSLRSGKEIKVRLKASKFSGGVSSGQYFLSIGMQYVPVSVAGSVAAGAEGEAVIKAEREFVFEAGERALLAKPEAKARIAAAVEAIA